MGRLETLGYHPFLIRPSRIARNETTLTLEVTEGASRVLISAGDQSIDLASDKYRVWCRRVRSPRRSDIDETDNDVASFIRRQYDIALRTLFSLSHRAAWMNDPFTENLLDENKLLQARFANLAGLITAPTLCTDDPDEATCFANQYETVAVKPTAGFMTELSEPEGAMLGVFTRRLNSQELLECIESVRPAPVLLQPYIEKAYELRITIVGDEILAARIDSQQSKRASVDWRRYDLANTPHTAIELDDDYQDRLLKFMRFAGLQFAAIDVIVDPRGVPVFLEANPCGQYGWIEDLTGLDISGAVARWLLKGE